MFSFMFCALLPIKNGVGCVLIAVLVNVIRSR